jgi:hypothetical protein
MVLQLVVVGPHVGVAAHHPHAEAVAVVTTHLARMTDANVTTTVETVAIAPAVQTIG